MLCSVVTASILLLPQLVNAVTVDAKLDGARKEGSLVVYTRCNQKIQPNWSSFIAVLVRLWMPLSFAPAARRS